MSLFKQKMRTLTSRTFLCMVSIFLAILVFVAVFLFFWFRGQMTERYRQLIRNSISNTDVIFNQYISSAKSMTYEWFSNSGGTACRLATQEDFSSYVPFILTVRNSINNLPYIQSVDFINKNKEVAISIGGTGSYIKDSSAQLIEKLEQSDRNSMFTWTVENRYSDKGSITLLTIYAMEVPLQAVGFTGAVATHIDAAKLSKNLFSETADDDLKILILDKDGIVIAQNNLTGYGEDYSNEEWVAEVFENKTLFEASINGERYEVISLRSQQTGFYIVALSQYATEMRNVIGIINILFIVILTAFIATVFITFLASKRLFRPFTKMLKTIKDSPMTDSIDFEKDDIAFLDNVYRHATSQLLTLTNKKENDFIIKNLLSNSAEGEVQQLLLHKQIIKENSPYLLINIHIDGNLPKEPISMQEYDLRRNVISNIYSQALETSGKCTCFEVGLRSILLIFSTSQVIINTNSFSKDLLESIRVSAQQASNSTVFVVSQWSTESEPQNCLRLYANTSDLLKTRVLLNNPTTFIPNSSLLNSYHTSNHSHIIQAIKWQNKQQYIAYVKQLLQQSDTTPYSIFSGILEELTWDIMKLHHTVNPSEINPENLRTQKELLHSQISTLDTAENILLWLDSLYNKTEIELNRIKNHSTAALMEDAVNYIRNNYDDCNLNVNLLAEKLNISSAYFGKLFYDFTGSKTLDYITKIRMEKAYNLLLSEPDKDINTIATLVGYNNSNYFSTTFKKHFSVAPSKLRDYNVTANKNEDVKQA